jgi:hypothetical protein
MGSLSAYHCCRSRPAASSPSTSAGLLHPPDQSIPTHRKRQVLQTFLKEGRPEREIAEIRAEGAYQAIVDKALFLRAREIVDARSGHFSDEELLDALRAILKRQGMLSGLIIDEGKDRNFKAYQRPVW